MFQGSIVALVTPMNKDGSLDIKSFNNLLDFHVQNKSDGVVVVGVLLLVLLLWHVTFFKIV